MKSQQLSLKLVPPGKSLTIDCDGCEDIKIYSPIFYKMMLELFGVSEEEEGRTEQDFLLKYHMNGHRVFARTDEPKQLVASSQISGDVLDDDTNLE